MSYILDIIIVALLGFLVIRSYQKGFLSTAIDALAVVISAIVTGKFYKPVSESVYDLAVRNLVETRFTRVLDEISVNLSLEDKISAMIDGLPQGAVKLAEVVGVSKASVMASMASAGGYSNDQLIQLAVDKIGHTIMINITEFITFVVMFVIITLLLKFLATIMKKANDIPVLGKLNSILGAVIGIVKAVAIVYIGCTIFYFIAGMSGAAPVIEAVNSSIIYNFIIQNNPIIAMVG